MIRPELVEEVDKDQIRNDMDRIHLMGLDFVSADFDQIIDEIRSRKYNATGYHPFVITPNADQVLKFNNDLKLKFFFEKSYFILPDGFPIMVYGKLVRKPLLKRLAGSDLFPRVWELIRKEGRNVFIIGPTDHVGKLLVKDIPSVRYHTAGFLTDELSFVNEANQIIAKVKHNMPDYIIIGLGFPKQEILSKLIYDGIPNVGAPLFMLLGASLEFYLKLKKRAPQWVQKLGMEWFHRLIHEPRRLWRRYTIGNIKFLIFFGRQYFKRSNPLCKSDFEK